MAISIETLALCKKLIKTCVDNVDTGKQIVVPNATNITLEPDVYYSLQVDRNLTISFGTPKAGRLNEYKGEIDTQGAESVVFPTDIVWIGDSTIEPNKLYEFSVVNNIGVIIAVR